MTAPAIVLVTSGPEEPGVAETLSTIVTSLRHARRDLKVHIGRVDGEPSISDILAGLASRDVAEAVLVPLDLVSAASHDERLATLAHSPDIRVAVSRPIGPTSELLNILDGRVREALHRNGALEIDGLVLAAPANGDLRGTSLLGRRARQWAAHHRLPVQLATDDGDGRATATAVASLRAQGRRHITVAAMYLTPTVQYHTMAHAGARAGAIAVTAPIGDSEQLRLLILARYAFGAMELLDGTPTQLPLESDDDEDA